MEVYVTFPEALARPRDIVLRFCCGSQRAANGILYPWCWNVPATQSSFDYLHKRVEKGVKISHSHSRSGSYPFCFSSLMQCMAPFFAVHGFCSCSELSFSIFCLIFFLRGASRERGGGGIFMYSHHLPIDLLQFNSYLVSLVRCLILCRVLRKAEKWDPVPTLWEHPLENEHKEGAEEGQPCGLTLCCMFVKNLPWNLRGLWMALWVGSNHKRLSRRDGMSPGL